MAAALPCLLFPGLSFCCCSSLFSAAVGLETDPLPNRSCQDCASHLLRGRGINLNSLLWKTCQQGSNGATSGGGGRRRKTAAGFWRKIPCRRVRPYASCGAHRQICTLPKELRVYDRLPGFKPGLKPLLWAAALLAPRRTKKSGVATSRRTRPVIGLCVAPP